MGPGNPSVAKNINLTITLIISNDAKDRNIPGSPRSGRYTQRRFNENDAVGPIFFYNNFVYVWKYKE